MCRLIMMNKQGEKELERQYGFKNYLNFLEKSKGGQGNGYALLKKGKVIELNKGVNLSIKEISNNIRRRNYDWCIFHTRLATIGSKSDENCHPFIKNNTEVLAMNGTESKVDFLAKPFEITDTEAILDFKVKYNFEIPFLKYFSSIFVGFSKGKPYVVANNLQKIKLLFNEKRNAIVFASEFPKTIKKIYKPISNFMWNNEKIDMSNYKKYTEAKQNKRKNCLNSFLIKDNIGIKEENFENLYLDEFDYYKDLYDIYEEKNVKKEGEKNGA